MMYLRLPLSCTACRPTVVSSFLETEDSVTVTFAQPGIIQRDPVEHRLQRTLTFDKQDENGAVQRGYKYMIQEIKQRTHNGTSLPYTFQCNVIGGYTGKLCQTCLPGYYKNMNKQCAQCFPLWQSVLLALSLFCGGTAALFVFIYVVMADAGSTSTAGSVQKILLNHFQLISSCIMYPLKWPEQLQTAFEVQGALSALGERVISVDCMLNTDVIDLNPFYIKQIIFSLLPIFAMSAAGAVLSCAYGLRQYRKRGKQPMVLDVHAVTDKVHKRHESRKKEVKQLFKMASKMAQVSGSTNAEETMQGETGFSLKRLKNTMGIAQQKETIRKHHEKTKALTNELMGYAQVHHGKSKQEMIERHAIATMRARQLMDFIHNMHVDISGIFQKYDTQLKGGVTTAEFETIVRQLGFHWPQRDIDALCDLFDGPGGNGMVELSHIISYEKSHWESYVLSVTVITFALYPTIVRSTFKLLACRQHLEEGNHDSYLQSDLNLPCYDGLHWVMLMFVGLPCLLVYVLGFPLGTYHVLYKNRNNWMDDSVMYRYGMLMAGYRHEIFYWEIVITARKACMIGISVFLATYGADVQVFVGIFVLVFFLGLHLHYNPYEIDDLNRLETAALASEFVTLYCGLLYFWEKFEDDQTGSQVLTIILIVMQGLFALGTLEVLFDQYVRRMGTETFFAGVYMKLKCVFTCGVLKPKEGNKGESSSTKVQPVQVDISNHMGTLAKKNASQEPMRGMKLFKKSAKIMSGFQRAERSTRNRYEANRRKLKVHFKNAVAQKKMHKEIRNNGSALVQKSLEELLSAPTSPTAINNLTNMIEDIKTMQQNGEHVAKSTLDMVQKGESRVYKMKTELIRFVKLQTKKARAARTVQLNKAIDNLNKSLQSLAEANIENQEKMINESLQVLSEMEECQELRKQILSMKRNDLSTVLSMTKPKPVVVHVMEAACYLLGMEITKETQNWKSCQKWLNAQGGSLFAEIRTFDPIDLT